VRVSGSWLARGWWRRHLGTDCFSAADLYGKSAQSLMHIHNEYSFVYGCVHNVAYQQRSLKNNRWGQTGEQRLNDLRPQQQITAADQRLNVSGCEQ